LFLQGDNQMNLISILSIAVVVCLTSYTIFQIYRHKDHLAMIAGMKIAMTLSVMTGLVAGFLMSVLHGDLFLSSGIGMITGLIVGILAGQPKGIIAILDGAVSGVISGIVGALFGVFLAIESPYMMLGIILVLYLIIIGFVILYIKVETNEKLSFDPKAISPFSIISAGVVLISLFLFLYSSDYVKLANSESTSETNQSEKISEISVINDPAPKIKIEVTPTGYTPNLIHVKKGVPVVLEIHNPLKDSCLSTFTMPAFNINNVNLKVNDTTKLTFTPTETGEFKFSCGMNMYGGKIIVE
jgi:glucan phosphoethanolaminetransferase (alkaline phosphatase superfamily)